ncbi:tail fiber assembly protein [Enterobacter sp. Ap-916]|uniref:tail fiber assembly protein n=1 Tax=unclassified Enterobacter TaxID=2608935 RepID=UPI0014246A1E|nr:MULTISPECIES: tail fiber assembly protein [unclassified Enterobacter]NIF56758.1 tail fiber assembly protein [Enterobacter sp. Ap-867]NIG29301.1 tail fiber assembly protein [Enterobacter sp. Ap-916]
MAKAKLNNDYIATVAGDITVFNYDGETREYTSTSVEFLPVGVGIPASSCTDEPGESKDGFTICRNVELTDWVYITDHRGDTVYSKLTGERITISTPGDYPSDTTTIAPATAYDKWDGEKWVTDIEAKKKDDISDAELKRRTLLSDASNITADWRTELTLGIINDTDKEKLIAWMEYIKAVKAIDTSTAPDIEWPQRTVV